MTTSPDNETRADILLRETLVLLAPLARALVAHGVTYPIFAQALKETFLNAANAELTSEGKRVTDSALSLLSGVHRKDVRALTRTDSPAGNRALSLASELVQRWVADPTFCGADGTARELPLRSKDPDEPTFERLAQSVTKDFHARSMLDELTRLGLARVENERVYLEADAFVPRRDFAEAAYYGALNIRDHIAASTANLRSIGRDERAPFPEYAVYADELSAESVEVLRKLAWSMADAAFRRVTQEAIERVNLDASLPASERNQRLRFGAFVFAEPMTDEATATGTAIAAAQDDIPDTAAADDTAVAHPSDGSTR